MNFWENFPSGSASRRFRARTSGPWRIPALGGGYFFLPGAAAGLFEKFVCTLAPRLASISLATWAFGPEGLSSRYFWKASWVPGGAIVLPLSIVALPISVSAY